MEINKFLLPAENLIALQMQNRIDEGKDIKLELLIARTLARSGDPETEKKIADILKDENKEVFEKIQELLEISREETEKLKFKTH